MKIEIKAVKHSEFASQETNCFEAKVYIDGKPFCVASNDGHGGCDNYYPINDKTSCNEINARIAEIDKELDGSFEFAVGDLLTEWLVSRDIKKYLKRVCYVKPEYKKGEFAQLPAKFKPCAGSYNSLRSASWWKDNYIILNELPMNEIRAYL